MNELDIVYNNYIKIYETKYEYYKRKYDEYCSKFSKAYLSGSCLYIYVNNCGGFDNFYYKLIYSKFNK
jgi:hypothetical protein